MPAHLTNFGKSLIGLVPLTQTHEQEAEPVYNHNEHKDSPLDLLPPRVIRDVSTRYQMHKCIHDQREADQVAPGARMEILHVEEWLLRARDIRTPGR